MINANNLHQLQDFVHASQKTSLLPEQKLALAVLSSYLYDLYLLNIEGKRIINRHDNLVRATSKWSFPERYKRMYCEAIDLPYHRFCTIENNMRFNIHSELADVLKGKITADIIAKYLI